MTITDLEKNLKINFKDKDLLKTAFVHRSYLNEHVGFRLPANERLEFLGDAVLQFLTSQYLYKNYLNSSEGELTNYRASLVCSPQLASISRELDLGDYLYLSRGENDTGGRNREYILANTFEALLGAIYLDRGIGTSRKFLERNLFPKLREIIEKKKFKDYKSHLQELAQEKLSETPVYKVIKEWGPDHDKHFEVAVLIKKKIIGKGPGSSKQKAEQAAAKIALEDLEKTPK